jgi:adenosylcobyric acid synthase
MAKAIMVQGTASHVGKSLLCTALCRILAADGYRVAPFKSWNMALNSYVTLDGGEIGRAQGEQAEAAGIDATVDMNPILVKPKGKGQSQVIIRGRAIADVGLEERTGTDYINFCLEVINRSYQALSREYDVIVIEGAGSPAEINLVEQDIANMKVARLANAPVLLAADLNRGGALAAVVGTMLLLPAEDRARVAGFIFNKFRGDRNLLAPGLSVVEERTGRPVLGVVPYLHDVRLAEEDGVALERRPEGVEEKAGKLLLKVVRLPYISNFTDLDALAAEEDTAVEYVSNAGSLAGADAVIVPGSKNSVSDLSFLRESGLADEIVTMARQGTPVAGICGGYQLLGKTLADPGGYESGGIPGRLPGLGLLDAETTFFAEKTVARAEARSLLHFAAEEEVKGYEIHMGQTLRTAGCRPAFTLKGEDGAVGRRRGRLRLRAHLGYLSARGI